MYPACNHQFPGALAPSEKLISKLPDSTLNLPPSAVEQMMDDLRELDNATHPVRVLVLKLTKPLAKPDAEMGEVSKGEDTRPVHEDSPSPAVLSADAKSPFIDLEKWHSALDTGGKGTWKLVITCWVHLELMCIFPTM